MSQDWSKLTLSNWQSLSLDEKRTQSITIGNTINAEFSGIEEFECGDQKHVVALFEKNDSQFSLIPGGTVTLGFAGRKPKISDEQHQDWLESLLDAGALDDGETIAYYLMRILSPKRTVNLRPFLIELKPLSAETIYEEADDNQSSCHDMIRASLSREGYRLPTSDEWEWACSGGSQSIFRWGDQPDLTERKPTCFDSKSLDQNPNSFGLHININPYHCETTDQEMLLRAGDGGSRECGCLYDSFITQASAYIEDISDSDAVAEFYEGVLVRRVIAI